MDVINVKTQRNPTFATSDIYEFNMSNPRIIQQKTHPKAQEFFSDWVYELST